MKKLLKALATATCMVMGSALVISIGILFTFMLDNVIHNISISAIITIAVGLILALTGLIMY